jgi:hypothetical protein
MTIEIGDIVEFIGMRHNRGEDKPVIGYVTDKDKEYALVQWFIDPRAIEIKQTSNPQTKWMHIAYLQKLSEDIDL